MAASTETTRLPIIKNVQITSSSKADSEHGGDNKEGMAGTKRKGETRQASSLLASFGLGSLRRQPLPGDVYERPYTCSANQPRPLGLLPSHRDKLETMRALVSILSPLPVSAPVYSTRTLLERAAPVGKGPVDTKGAEPQTDSQKQSAEGYQSATAAGVIAAVSVHNQSHQATQDTSTPGQPVAACPNPSPLPFRLPSKTLQEAASNSSDPDPDTNLTGGVQATRETPLGLPPIQRIRINGEEASAADQRPTTATTEDPEYVDTLAKCDIQQYGLPGSCTVAPPRPDGPSNGRQPKDNGGEATQSKTKKAPVQRGGEKGGLTLLSGGKESSKSRRYVIVLFILISIIVTLYLLFVLQGKSRSPVCQLHRASPTLQPFLPRRPQGSSRLRALRAVSPEGRAVLPVQGTAHRRGVHHFGRHRARRR